MWPILLLSFSGVLRAEYVLFGITAGNLVIVDHNDPTQVTVVGPTNLASQGVVRPISLAWNPQDGYLYGLGYDAPTGQPRTAEYLFRVDRATGAGSVVANLGNPTTYKYQGLEYVETLHSLVASSGTRETMSDLSALTADGAITPLLNNGFDNDWIVFDSFFDVFISTHVNINIDASQSVSTNLSSGQTTSLGLLPLDLADWAYNPDDGYIYGHSTFPNVPDPVPVMYRIQTNAGGAPIAYEQLAGQVPGDWLMGVAFGSAVPEPATWLMLGGALLAVALRRSLSCTRWCRRSWRT